MAIGSIGRWELDTIYGGRLVAWDPSSDDSRGTTIVGCTSSDTRRRTSVVGIQRISQRSHEIVIHYNMSVLKLQYANRSALHVLMLVSA